MNISLICHNIDSNSGWDDHTGDLDGEGPEKASKSTSPSQGSKEEMSQSLQENKPKPTEYPKQFEELWKAYPRKVSKGSALRAYKKAIKKVDHNTLLQAIELYKKSGDVTRGFVCLFATWLNGDRWLDEETQPEIKQEETANACQGGITQSDETSNVRFIREKILRRVGETFYKSWYQQCKIVEHEDCIEIIAPTRFVHDYIARNMIETAMNIQELFSKEIKLDYLNTLPGNQIKPIEGDNYVSATQVPKSDLIGLESALC